MADLDGLEVKYVGNRFVADWNGVIYTDTNAERLVETVGLANAALGAPTEGEPTQGELA